MSIKLLTEHHLAFLSLKGAAKVRLSLHMSKYHIGGNHISRLNYVSAPYDVMRQMDGLNF